MSERTHDALLGLAAGVLLAGLVTLGVLYAFGTYDDGYRIVARFDAAGQGLIPGSDVKIRGVNVGRVDDIDLEAGRARVTLFIDADERIPVTAQAVVRPKTLFGEKFVDIIPGPDETTGPFLGDGDELTDTLGGFELERVLADAYPVLLAIDPGELAVILDTLAEGGRGLGEQINRQIGNFALLADVQARNDPRVRSLLSDLARLADELAGRSGDLVAGARDLNVVLPTVNARHDTLTAALDDVTHLAGDLADLLDANRSFLRKSVTEGGRAIQVLFDERDDIVPLVIGLRRYSQTLVEAGRIPVGDGTVMAAVKSPTNLAVLLGVPLDGVGAGPAAAPDVVAAPPVLGTRATTGTVGILELVTGTVLAVPGVAEVGP